jgi:hypothetical protein
MNNPQFPIVSSLSGMTNGLNARLFYTQRKAATPQPSRFFGATDSLSAGSATRLEYIATNEAGVVSLFSIIPAQRGYIPVQPCIVLRPVASVKAKFSMKSYIPILMFS